MARMSCKRSLRGQNHASLLTLLAQSVSFSELPYPPYQEAEERRVTRFSLP